MNISIVQGNIGSINYKPSNNGKTSLVSYSVAINKKTKTGEKATNWISVKSFGKTADFINQYFTVGKPISVTGHLQSEEWKTEDGSNRSRMVVIGTSIEFALTERSKGEPTQNTTFDQSIEPAHAFASSDEPF